MQNSAGKIVILIVGLTLLFAFIVEAQVNFSPSWGKRAGSINSLKSEDMTANDQSDMAGFPENCKPPLLSNMARIQQLITVIIS